MVGTSYMKSIFPLIHFHASSSGTHAVKINVPQNNTYESEISYVIIIFIIDACQLLMSVAFSIIFMLI